MSDTDNSKQCEICGEVVSNDYDLCGCEMCGRMFCSKCNSINGDICVECIE